MEGKSLINKFFQYMIGSGLALVIGFITSPIITRLVDPLDYGKYSLFIVFSNVINLLILMGMDQSFGRYYFEELDKHRGKLLYNCLKIPLYICCSVSIMILILSKPISDYLFGSYNIKLIILLVFNNFFMLFSRFAILVIRMRQNAKFYSILLVLQKLILLLIVIICIIPIKSNVFTLIFAFVITNFIVALIAIIKSRDIWHLKNTKIINYQLQQYKLFKFGFPLLFTMLITWLFQSVDRIFLKYYSGYHELGIYSAAFSIIALLNAVQSAFTTFWIPVAYERYKENPDDKKFYEKIIDVVTFGMFLIAILIILLKDLIIFLLGAEYQNASFIMPFLVFMPLMYTISETTVVGINFREKSVYHIWIALISLFVNICGNFLLVPSYEAIGAAISTGVSYIVFFTLRTFIAFKFYPLKFNYCRFWIITFLVSIFALYASFNKFDFVSIFLFLVVLAILLILYKELLMEIKILFSRTFKKKQV